MKFNKERIGIVELSRDDIGYMLDPKVPIEHKGKFESFKEKLRESDIIVATPAAFFIIGEHSVMHGHPALYMPIPLYLYLGLKRSSNNDINIEIWARSPNDYKNRFENFKWKYGEKEKLEQKIKNLFRKRDYPTGYNIYALMEMPPRCGLNSSGAFSAALSIAATLLNKGCGLGMINKWSKIDKLNKLKKDDIFNYVFDVAWEIDWEIQNGSSGIGPFASLVGSDGSPIVYFTENPKGEQVYKKRYKWRKWYAWFLSEILTKSEMNVFTKYYFALIYSGKSSRTSEAFSTLKTTIEFSSDNIDVFTEKILDDIYEKELESISTPLHHLLKKGLSERNIDFGMLNGTDNKILYNIEEYLLEKVFAVLGGFSLIGISNIICRPEILINMINVYQAVLSSLGLSTKEIDEICNVLNGLDLPRSIRVGAKLTGSGAGGDVVVISRGKDICKKVKEICEQRGYPIHFEYAGDNSNLMSNIGVYINKLCPVKIDSEDTPNKEAYIGLFRVRLKNDSKYTNRGQFSDENISIMESLFAFVNTELENLLDKLKKKNIKLDALVFPEFSILPEDHPKHRELLNRLQEISDKHDMVIIGGSYLTKNCQSVCPVFLPSREIENQFKLWKSKYDPNHFIEGNGLKIFTNTKIGNFCVLICYDFTSHDEIPNIIKEIRYNLGGSFTIFVVACNPAKKEFKRLANEYVKKSYSYVLISDSFEDGLELCATPMEKHSIMSPIYEDDKLVVFKLEIDTLTRAFERKIHNKKSPRPP